MKRKYIVVGVNTNRTFVGLDLCCFGIFKTKKKAEQCCKENKEVYKGLINFYEVTCED